MKNEDKRILIVDDISKNIQVLGSILKEQSYKVGYALNGEQALTLIQNNDFDLILLDIMMPGMNGYEVCRIIRKEHSKDIPIIFLTAKTDKEDIVEGLKSGAQDYVTKPFNTAELLSRVETHLELKDKREQLADLNADLEQKVKDRTEEVQRLYNKLEHFDKAKGDFLKIIAHELRTPLNGIFGFAQILNDVVEDEEQKEFISYVINSAHRLNKFAEAALLVTQLTAQNYEFHFTDHSFKELIVSILPEFETEASSKEITFDIKGFSSEDTYKFDINMIQRAFQTILHNAVKYSPQKGTINVSFKNTEQGSEISFTDQGKGFSEEALQRLFEFFGGDDAMHHSEGHGLGLAAAKLIMEAHEGDIKVENIESGGARIRLVFPVNN